MKRRLGLLLTLFLAAGWIACAMARTTGSAPEGTEAPAKAPGVTRLVTYNVGVFNKYIRDDYRLVADMMREIGADAVCLNELDSCAVRTRGVFQLERVAGLMGGWDFCYGPAMPFQGGAYGEGVMTREPAVRKFFVPLPQAGGAEPRVLAVVELPCFVIATTHLDHVSVEAQVEQVREINRVMRERYGRSAKPVFLGGDLNAEPGSETLRELRRAWRVLSGTDAGTYPSDGPTVCIDYFLQLDNGVACDVVDARVLDRFRAGDVSGASDHLPVMLDIKLE